MDGKAATLGLRTRGRCTTSARIFRITLVGRESFYVVLGRIPGSCSRRFILGLTGMGFSMSAWLGYWFRKMRRLRMRWIQWIESIYDLYDEHEIDCEYFRIDYVYTQFVPGIAFACWKLSSLQAFLDTCRCIPNSNIIHIQYSSFHILQETARRYRRLPWLKIVTPYPVIITGR